ncbi:peptidoglycan DD-metalloendopeptidase family protein [Nonomuraea jabiensis]|uniref:peptidoglycan DD-metalloendopeptidase family protein n=1 Tax=Nonomuraea jabiensis TaxID=882448 RepID=UPI00368F283B
MASLPLTPATHPPAFTTSLTLRARPNQSTEPDTRHPIGAHPVCGFHQAAHPNTTPYPRSTRQDTPSPPTHKSPKPAQNPASPSARHLLDPPREAEPSRLRQTPTPSQEPTSPRTAQAPNPRQEATPPRARQTPTPSQEPAPPPTAQAPNRRQEAVPPRPRHALRAAQSALTTLLFAATAIFLLPAPPARASPPTWRWPLDGHPRVLRRFTPPPEPWLAGHRGIDLAAPLSAPVLAAGSGTVRFAGPVAGKGVVTVEHEGGLRTTYLHVKASVRRGQPVAPGSELGVVETSQGHCRESCLHWGLRRGTHYLDPLLLLGQATIRLLPFWNEDESPLPPVNEHSLRDVDKHERPLQPPAGETTRPLTTQPRRSPATLSPALPAPPALPASAPPAQPKALAAASPTPTLIMHTTHSLPPDTSSPDRHDSTPSQRHPLAAADSLTPTASRGRHHPTPPTTTLDFLTRSASTTTTSAIGLGTLLGIGLLITALRSHRRTRTDHRPRRRGQHRANTGEEQGPETTGTRHRGAKHPTPNRPTTANAKPGRHRKTANHRN